MGRPIFVSNRLPVTVRIDRGEIVIDRSVGGLATALGSTRHGADALWVGWPGVARGLDAPQREEVERRLEEEGCKAVWLLRSEIESYYEEISNGILWPLFHYQADRLPLEPTHWDAYAEVNERFANSVADVWRPGDDIWVHDYQLMLLPAMLRQRLPSARIGFFLHIPFPSLEMLRILPWRRELIQGMLGADLVGLHTPSYARHFVEAAERLLGLTSENGHLDYEGRRVRVGAYPIGIDAEAFRAAAASAPVQAMVRELRGEREDKLILGVDRLDYTKGIPRRLLAFRRMLETSPSLRGKVRLIQIVVPSRTGVQSYREFRHQLDALVGKINGAYGTSLWTPVNYQFRALPREELVAHYAAADVMFVTPLRDGMNLVAKEYVACRTNGDGVLVLSEFAGAAEDLREALIVNPYDVEGTALRLEAALALPLRDQQRRMRALRRRVFSGNSVEWANRFLTHLRTTGKRQGGADLPIPVSGEEEVAKLAYRIRHANARLLLLDYDGTLVSFVNDPAKAKPDRRVVRLLAELAESEATELHIVSGRSQKELDAWLGHLPIGLHAEHGLWSRPPGGEWEQRELLTEPPYAELLEILTRHADRLEGALVEEKSAGLAWHYRKADESAGRLAAGRLVREITPLAAASDLDVLQGNRVVELRPAGINKGTIAERIGDQDRLIVAMGDDRTDEDLFAALPDGSVSIHVGPSPSRARYRLKDVDEARAFLATITPRRRTD